MKKRLFAIFLVLALLLTALAGCGQDENKSSSKSSKDDDEEEEQLLEKGYYEVLDEDEDTVGYLYVTSSKITVYDKRGREDDKFGYDYNAKKERYTLDDGELFGSEEFTVKKNRGTLTLVTEDDEEYTLEEIEKDELPGGDSSSAGANDAPAGNDTPAGDISIPGPGSSDAPDWDDLKAAYIGDNGSVGLYGWMPDPLRYALDDYSDDGIFTAMASEYDADMGLFFYCVLSSGDNLANAVEEARNDYEGSYGSDADLLFCYIRDGMMVENFESGYFLDSYLDDDLDYYLDENNIAINGRNWRYCDAYVYGDDAEAYMTMNFWMEGNDMVIVILGGVVEGGAYSGDMYTAVNDMLFSLELDT